MGWEWSFAIVQRFWYLLEEKKIRNWVLEVPGEIVSSNVIQFYDWVDLVYPSILSNKPINHGVVAKRTAKSISVTWNNSSNPSRDLIKNIW